jgi:hypothetical protein
MSPKANAGMNRLINRFPERQPQIERMATVDLEFREICLDYEEVAQALTYWRQPSSASLVSKIDECETMLQVLETEALQHLREAEAG